MWNPHSNKKIYVESRIYTENEQVKVRHIVRESPIYDMASHSTETRIFIKNGVAVSVLSDEITKSGAMSVELAKQITIEKLRIEYQHHKQYGYAKT